MNKLLIVEILTTVMLLFAVESKADVLGELGNLAGFGQCGASVNSDPDFQKCKEKVTDNWKAEANDKKQVCCKPLSFMDCTLETAKKSCGENEYKVFEKAQKVILNADTQCIMYRNTPSMCGTNAILPVLSTIIISILVVLRIS